MKDDHRIEDIREIIWNNKRVRAFDSYDKDNVFEGTFTAPLRTPKSALWEMVEKITGEVFEPS
jgi:hypothetical protein